LTNYLLADEACEKKVWTINRRLHFCRGRK